MTILEARDEHSSDERNLAVLEKFGDHFPWYKEGNDNVNLTAIKQIVDAYNNSVFTIQATVVETVDSSKHDHILTVVARKPEQDAESSVINRPMVLFRMPLFSERVSAHEFRHIQLATGIFGNEADSLGNALIKEVAPLRIHQDIQRSKGQSHSFGESKRVIRVASTDESNALSSVYIDDKKLIAALQKALAQTGVDMQENLAPIETVRLAQDRLEQAGFDLSRLSNDPVKRLKAIFGLILAAKQKMVPLEKLDVTLNNLHVERKEADVVLALLGTMRGATKNWFLRHAAPPETIQALKLVVEAASAKMVQAMFPDKTPDQIAEIMANNTEMQRDILVKQAKAKAEATLVEEKGKVEGQKAHILAAIDEQSQHNKLGQERLENFTEFLQEKIHDLSYGARDFFIDPDTGTVVKTADMAGVLFAKVWNSVRSTEGIGFAAGGGAGFVLGVGLESLIVSNLPKLTFFSTSGGNWIIGATTIFGGLVGSYIAYRASGGKKSTTERAGVGNTGLQDIRSGISRP